MLLISLLILVATFCNADPTFKNYYGVHVDISSDATTDQVNQIKKATGGANDKCFGSEIVCSATSVDDINKDLVSDVVGGSDENDLDTFNSCIMDAIDGADLSSDVTILFAFSVSQVSDPKDKCQGIQSDEPDNFKCANSNFCSVNAAAPSGSSASSTGSSASSKSTSAVSSESTGSSSLTSVTSSASHETSSAAHSTSSATESSASSAAPSETSAAASASESASVSSAAASETTGAATSTTAGNSSTGSSSPVKMIFVAFSILFVSFFYLL